MKKITTIFSKEDTDKFRIECGYFLEGDDRLLERWKLPKYVGIYETDIQMIELSMKILEEGDNLILGELREHLSDDITRLDREIESKLKEIEDTKETLEKRKKALELSKGTKNFYSFFKKIIKLI